MLSDMAAMNNSCTDDYTHDPSHMDTDVNMQDGKESMFATKAAAKSYKKRIGAKAVKSFERNHANAKGVLSSQSATTFRAISARANFLAQDRADGAYITPKSTVEGLQLRVSTRCKAQKNRSLTARNIS